jgi:hypothetical protein
MLDHIRFGAAALAALLLTGCNPVSESLDGWVQRFGEGSAVSMGGAAVSENGDVTVAGSYDGALRVGDQTLEGGGLRSAFVASFRADGSFAWSRSSAAIDEGSSIDVLAVAAGLSGETIIGGRYRYRVDLGAGKPPPGLPPEHGGFVAKLDATGAVLWDRRIRSLEGDSGNDGIDVLAIGVDAAGRIDVLAQCQAGAQLDGVVLEGDVGWGQCLLQLDAGGTALWGTRDDATYAAFSKNSVMRVDAEGSMLIAGARSDGLFVVKRDPDGGFAWERDVAGDQHATVFAMSSSADGDALLLASPSEGAAAEVHRLSPDAVGLESPSLPSGVAMSAADWMVDGDLVLGGRTDDQPGEGAARFARYTADIGYGGQAEIAEDWMITDVRAHPDGGFVTSGVTMGAQSFVVARHRFSP